MSEQQSKYYLGLGLRKTSRSIAKIYLNNKNSISVNGKSIDEYFTPIERSSMEYKIDKIFSAAGFKTSEFEVHVKVLGSGKKSQADAVVKGIANAVLEFISLTMNTDTYKEVKQILRQNDFVTVDSRQKEKKKPGMKKARRARQFSKR